jgi:hypothetical protein
MRSKPFRFAHDVEQWLFRDKAADIIQQRFQVSTGNVNRAGSDVWSDYHIRHHP